MKNIDGVKIVDKCDNDSNKFVEKLSVLLENDPDIINFNNMTDDDANKAFKKLHLDPDEVTSEPMEFVQKAKDLAVDKYMGSVANTYSENQFINQILVGEQKSSDKITRWIGKQLNKPAHGSTKTEILHTISDKTPIIRGYKDYQKEVPTNDICKWIAQLTSNFHTLLSNDALAITVITIDSHGNKIPSMWLEIGKNNNILVVDQLMRKKEKINEIYYLMSLSFNQPFDEGNYMLANISEVKKDEKSNKLKRELTYTELQTTVDEDKKKLVAIWAVNNFGVLNGAGVFFDAGSQCYEAWKETVNNILEKKMGLLSISTNNNLVLQDWTKKFRLSALLGTTVKLTGNDYDPEHQAFHGNVESNNKGYRPSVEFIGTSGIEIEEQEIFLGYHADSRERDTKESLFRSPAKIRVILVTPIKIGNSGGQVYDIFSIENIDTRAPIYLVTAEPDKKDLERFETAKTNFQSEKLKKIVREKGLQITWITIAKDKNGLPVEKERMSIK